MEKKIKRFLHTYKRTLLLGLGLAAVIGVSLYFFVPNPSKSSRAEGMVDDVALEVIAAFDGEGSVVCKVSTDSIKGTVYIKNGKVRVVQPEGEEYQNVILENDTVFTWNNNEPKGMKVDLNKNPIVKSFINESEIRKQIEANTPECVVENIDNELFSIPGEVNFEELDINIQNVLNGGR